MSNMKHKDILDALLEDARKLNEEEELAAEVSKTDVEANATIPDENTEVKPVDAKEDDLVDNENKTDVTLKEEEELAPETSKTDVEANATIPDENTEVKPVDAKEGDFIENKNDEDVTLTESDDDSEDKDEKSDEDKDDESEDKEDESDDEKDDSKDDEEKSDEKDDDSDEKKDSEELTESEKDDAKLKAAAAKAHKTGKEKDWNAVMKELDELEPPIGPGGSGRIRGGKVYNESLAEKLFGMFLEELELDAEESKTDVEANATIPDENTEVKPVDATESDFIDNENKEDVELTESNSTTKKENKEAAVRAAAERYGKDSPEYKNAKARADMALIGHSAQEKHLNKVFGDDEKKKARARAVLIASARKMKPENAGYEAEELVDMFFEALELDAEVSKTDVEANATIPDENTEVVSVDAKEDDFIDNENDLDVELTEEVLFELFEKYRAKKAREKANSYDTRATEQESHAAQKRTASDDAKKAADAYRGAGAAKKAAGDNAGAAKDYVAASDQQKKSFRAGINAAGNAVAADLNRKKQGTMDAKAKLMDAKLARKATLKAVRKGKSVSLEEAQLFEAFKLFLEEMGLNDTVDSATDNMDNDIPTYADQPIAPVVGTDEILDSATDKTSDIQESEDLTPETSKTDVEANATIPDENTEVKPVDAKEGDFIENENDLDVELTEAFERFRAWYHGKRSKANAKKSIKEEGKRTNARDEHEKVKAEQEKNRKEQTDPANAGDAMKQATTEHYGKLLEKDAKHFERKRVQAENRRKVADATKEYHDSAKATLDTKIKYKKMERDMNKAHREARKMGKAYIRESSDLEALFNIFLEDMGITEEILDTNTRDLEVAAEIENIAPTPEIDVTDDVTVTDVPADNDVIVTDAQITESINNIFKYLKEEGLDLGTEESKTDVEANATIPDENTEVKPVDATESDFIDNENKEDVTLKEELKVRSLREAYSAPRGYYSQSSTRVVTAQDKLNSLTESLAFIEAKNAKDYLFEELLRAVNKVELLRESIFDKYGEEAAAKAEKIIRLNQ